jgi:hypothetical protein
MRARRRQTSSRRMVEWGGRELQYLWSCPVSVDTLIYPRFRGVRVLESGGVVGAEVAVLVLGWGEHAKSGVAASGVVEEFDVVVDC